MRTLVGFVSEVKATGQRYLLPGFLRLLSVAPHRRVREQTAPSQRLLRWKKVSFFGGGYFRGGARGDAEL